MTVREMSNSDSHNDESSRLPNDEMEKDGEAGGILLRLSRGNVREDEEPIGKHPVSTSQDMELEKFPPYSPFVALAGWVAACLQFLLFYGNARLGSQPDPALVALFRHPSLNLLVSSAVFLVVYCFFALLSLWIAWKKMGFRWGTHGKVLALVSTCLLMWPLLEAMLAL